MVPVATEVAPVFVTTDVTRALAHYRRLGFDAEAFGDVYGFLTLGPVHIHVARVDHVDPKTTNVACYLYVADADDVHRRWTSSGADGSFHPPTDSDYAMREGAHLDPDGNLIRYGSSI